MNELIITSAISGAEVTQQDNPAVPYTVAETAREAHGAYAAGASIIHLHVRNDDGTPTQSKDRFKACIDAIRDACPDVIIQPSTGGAVGMTDMERLQSTEVAEPAVNLAHPEMATLDCGTCNFGGDDIFVNSDTTIETFGRVMIERGIKPELEVFDKGMIDTALKMAARGVIRSPMHFDFVMGVQIAATARDLAYMAQSIPKDATWTAAGIGRHQMAMAAVAIAMGGHVRVGFEDNIYLSKGVLAPSNKDLVDKVVRIARELGRPIASPARARQILSLPPLTRG